MAPDVCEDMYGDAITLSEDDTTALSGLLNKVGIDDSVDIWNIDVPAFQRINKRMVKELFEIDLTASESLVQVPSVWGTANIHKMIKEGAFRLLQKGAIGNSANSLFTLFKIDDTNMFVKFVSFDRIQNNTIDDPLLDCVVGKVMQTSSIFTSLRPHIINYKTSFLTYLDTTTNCATGLKCTGVWPIQDILTPDSSVCPLTTNVSTVTSKFFYASVFSALHDRPLRNILLNPHKVSRARRALDAIPRFLTALREVGFKTGFVHGDMHMNNVYYDNGNIVMIDYGRCTILQREVNDVNMDNLVRIESARNIRGITTYQHLIDNTNAKPFMAHHLAEFKTNGGYIAPIFDILTFSLGVEQLRKRADKTHNAFNAFIDIGFDPTSKNYTYNIPAFNKKNQLAVHTFNVVQSYIDMYDTLSYPPDKALAEGLLYFVLYVTNCFYDLQYIAQFNKNIIISDLSSVISMVIRGRVTPVYEKAQFLTRLQTIFYSKAMHPLLLPHHIPFWTQHHDAAAPISGGSINKKQPRRSRRKQRGGDEDEDEDCNGEAQFLEGMIDTDEYNVDASAFSSYLKGGGGKTNQRPPRVKYQGRTRVLRTGPRGGKYVMVGGKKVYGI